ncbi:hypothetical protein LBMAG27_09100 [Bacteroidota bacterium]|nr:hypothetical protein LBMAG27_09100 [Bacteroidota bacterium]
MKNETPNKSSEKKQSDASTYAKYSSVGFQLIAAVMFGFTAGYFTDLFFHLQLPIFKTLFSFGGVLLGLYIVIKEVSKP